MRTDYSKEFDIAETIVATIMETANEEQQAQLLDWLAESEENRKLYRRLVQNETIVALINQRQAIELDKVVDSIQHKIEANNKTTCVLSGRNRIRIAAAACIAIAVALSITFTVYNKTTEEDISLTSTSAKASKVKMLLADGEELIIDGTDEDIIATNGFISRNEKGIVLNDENGEATTNAPIKLNKVITEKGGEIFMTLSDGTGVRLNAESELSIPSKFEPNERRVFLSGEAYFEVAPNANSPFIVVADQMNIRVLGTTLNVKAYKNEPRMTTTLISGRVSVTTKSSEAELKPGMAADIDRSSEEIQVSEVDIALATAWINGYYMFNDEQLDEITRVLSRWYDVDFVFDDDLSKQQIFSGRVQKSNTIEEILHQITLSGGPCFSVENKKVHVK